MNNIELLVRALQACDISVTVETCSLTGYDDKVHNCTLVSTDFWTGEDTLEFVFNPETGRRVDTVLECPIVKTQEENATKKKKRRKGVDK